MAATLSLTSDIIIALSTLLAGAIGFYFITKFQLKGLSEDNKDIKMEVKEIKGTLNTLIVGQAKMDTEVSYLKDEIRSYRNNATT